MYLLSELLAAAAGGAFGALPEGDILRLDR